MDLAKGAVTESSPSPFFNWTTQSADPMSSRGWVRILKCSNRESRNRETQLSLVKLLRSGWRAWGKMERRDLEGLSTWWWHKQFTLSGVKKSLHFVSEMPYTIQVKVPKSASYTLVQKSLISQPLLHHGTSIDPRQQRIYQIHTQ